MHKQKLAGYLVIGFTVFSRDAQAAGETGNYAKLESAIGDFDGDDEIDLVRGVPAADSNKGAIDVIYDWAADPYSMTADETWTRDSTGMLDTAVTGDYFGSDVAVGDFDNDGYDDVAIGVPGDEVGSTVLDGGSVHIIYGSSSGLSSTGNEVWNQDTSGVLGTAESYDYFGEFLTVGDFNCDGYADLAIGVPQEDLATLSDAGVVHILLGSSGGLTEAGDQEWTQDTSGIEGVSASDDNFGAALNGGNFNGDYSGTYSCDDLAIGVPGEMVSGQSSAGAVNVVYGSGSGLSSTGDQLWSQDTTGIADVSDLREAFGTKIGTPDLDMDSYDDLVVIVDDETTCSSGEMGLHDFYGSSGGISDVDDTLYCDPQEGEHEELCNNATLLDCTLAFLQWCADLDATLNDPPCTSNGNGTTTCKCSWTD